MWPHYVGTLGYQHKLSWLHYQCNISHPLHQLCLLYPQPSNQSYLTGERYNQLHQRWSHQCYHNEPWPSQLPQSTWQRWSPTKWNTNQQHSQSRPLPQSFYIIKKNNYLLLVFFTFLRLRLSTSSSYSSSPGSLTDGLALTISSK